MTKNNILTPTQIVFALFLVFVTGQFSYAQAQYNPESGDAAYIAEIDELNENLTSQEVEGTASFIVVDDQLHITIIVKGLSPSISHIQHFHGFKSGNKESFCAEDEADTNGDGIVDLMETHPSSGVTLVPFNDAPADLKILTSTYPVANEDGLQTYRMTVSLDDLQSAVQDSYGIDELSLENYVFYIHGVPEGTSLPGTVESLPGVPAQVTVPVACGEVEAL